MADELNKDISEDEAASYEALRDDLEVVIKAMQAHMGRFPTKDEVVTFLFAETDREREDILSRGIRNGS